METSFFDFSMGDGNVYLYIQNIVDMSMSLWVPFVLIALAVARKVYNTRKSEIKINEPHPLLGVAYPRKRK